MIKSKLKKRYLLYHLFLIIFITGLAGAFLWDLGETLPYWVKIILVIVIIVYPIFVLYSVLKIPKIEIKEDRIIETSFRQQKEISFKDINNVIPSKFLNRIYKIGLYYSVQSKNKMDINIPHKLYSNEQELIQQIEKKLNTEP